MPLLIANPELSVNFIDSSGKRINFIKDVLSNIGIIATSTHERAEDVGKIPNFVSNTILLRQELLHRLMFFVNTACHS